MTATRDEIIRSYLGDLIAVLDHVSEAVSIQAGNEDFRRVAHAGRVIDNLNTVLVRQHADLEAHVKSMGGTSGGGVLKDVLGTVAGALAGLYGKMRGETACRMLRDDHTALTFVTVCTTMLHTIALALDDSATAALTLRHIQEYPPLILALGELLPHAVVADLIADKNLVVNLAAAEQAIRNLNDSWHGASAAIPT